MGKQLIVTRVEALRIPHPWKTQIYAIVHTDAALTGIGEATVGQVSLAVVGAIREIEPTVLGIDPHDVGLVRHRVLRDIYADGGQVTAAALAGIETALWDIIAQAANRPLFHLLGGRVQPRLRVYANGWYRAERDPDAIAALAAGVVAKGYTALKIDPFGSSWRTISRREIDRSIAILRSVRAAVGDEVDLIVEAHSRFDAATAARVAKLLEPLNPFWFEEPVPYTDLLGYRELVQKTSIPIAAGESLWRVEQFVELLSVVRIPIIQFDPTHVGGIIASRAITELALAHNAMIAPHSASGPVNELSCAHLATSAPHAILLERFQDFERPYDENPAIESALVVADGFATLHDLPGLGARYSIERLRALADTGARRDQNLFQEGWELRRGQ